MLLLNICPIQKLEKEEVQEWLGAIKYYKVSKKEFGLV